MKSIIKLSLFLTIIILTSCDVINENLVMAYFDKDEKNITLQTGTDPLIFGIKEVLLQNDWTVLTFSDSFEQTDPTYSAINTRYLMVSDYNQGKDIIYGDFVQDYEFIIYDTDTESEVVILYGSQRTVDQVLKEFKTKIESNDA